MNHLESSAYRLVNDIVFKTFFASEGGAELLRHFLCAALKIPLEKLKGILIKNPEIKRDSIEQRNIILDLLLELADGQKIHVEVQVGKHAFFKHRIIYQHARLATDQLESGDDFELQKQISLVIMDFVLFKENPEVFHNQFLWRNEQGMAFTDITEIHTVELPKVPQLADTDELNWYDLFRARNEADFKRIAGKSQIMAKAVKHLEQILTNDEVREMARARDQQRRIDNGNRKEAKAEERLEIAKNALSKGYPIEVIQDFTGLDYVLLVQLRQQLHSQ
ncbi:MAG: Rpn family recombination-promoting nuclease/putative transposase [Turicibacter sp.]|nr:Rpn family recombination-promoting nuclease/putative transposase [Turicibacter sp.]